MQSQNPVLTDSTFTRYGYENRTDAMTMQGTVTKTAILLFITLVSAAWTWVKFYKSGGDAAALAPWMIGSAIVGLVVAMATVFKPAWSSFTAPLYALVEGVFVGGLSATMEVAFPGIVIQATALTFGTLFAMLGVYQSGLIKVTDGFRFGIAAATGGIALFYVVAMILGFFNINIPFISGGGWLGIGFSLFVIAIAALNFVLDFDFIEQGAKRGVPKYMEWYGAFALIVTLIWLYVEFVRLLAKIRRD